MLECVVNISEGRDGQVIGAVAAAAGTCLLDVHSDAHHHRSVLTLGGPDSDVEAAARAVARAAIGLIDLRGHAGMHPRLGALDVVPFVPVDGGDLGPALAARDAFAAWAGEALDLPCFLYGPERSLPDVRRQAFASLAPDTGPARPHPAAGACCVGARGWLVAYNVWLVAGTALTVARAVAAAVRSPVARTLGLVVGDSCQVSFNLVEPLSFGPADAFDQVAARTPVAGTELVGLLPTAVLEATRPDRWTQLDLDRSRTIEARLAEGWRIG